MQCHGEHNLVEIFQKRNFTCDCGTTRIPSSSPCAIRTNEATNTRGDVSDEEPYANNKYNQNFKNRFCSCECDYDPFQQKGTMFQCLGLGTHEQGGCGEDWYHPGCLVGMGPKWWEKMDKPEKKEGESASENGLTTIKEENVSTDKKEGETTASNGETKKDSNEEAVEEDDVPLPPGFPEEDAFEGFICYKCVEANPWIKRYAGTHGFLAPVYTQQGISQAESQNNASESKKRKADDNDEDSSEPQYKRAKSETLTELESSAVRTQNRAPTLSSTCKLPNLPPAPAHPFSLFFKEGFRDSFCHCMARCWPTLSIFPQLLEEEETYEPPLSSDGGNSAPGGSTNGSGSLLDRGESALRNVDRVRAIEGVMAYNHLKEQLKPFFQQFAESGEAIGAEDIKAYFAKLRGDEQGIKEAGERAKEGGGNNEEGGEGDGRREQSGY